MNKTIIKFITVALLCITALVSCKKESVGSVNLVDSLILYVGESATLTVTFVPANAHNKKVSWESSDSGIATVENGKVTGIAIGEAKITVTSQDNGRTTQCIVYVIQPIEPEEMIWVEGGTFMMGCAEEKYCSEDEKPAHEVTLSGFYISKYETTQKVWVAAMGRNPSFPGVNYTGDRKPVHCISWNNVQVFISRLNAFTGKNYRLPTEAEWEFAARGGNKSEGYIFSGSNNSLEVGWGGYPHDVGKLKPNELGIYDMSGNVFEFCSDWYGPYSGIPQTNPTGAPNGNERIIRGYGWFTGIWFVSTRFSVPPDQIEAGGFRLVLPAE